MTITRPLTGLALAAALLVTAPATAHASTGTAAADGHSAAEWGPYYAPGGKAKVQGTVATYGEDQADIPAAATGRISGRLRDLTRGSSCGWAVFRITYRTENGGLPFKHRSVVDCTYGTPKPFSFRQHDLYQVELKVCSGPRAAKPSLTCLYSGTWKSLYLAG
ncbi:hypothetical protein GCM10010517_69810 [Streptosporangium fragile]|uniref:Secreted protein n=1 Tax=Streptosporangium fragile TaxID=46186 RepID=A0ABN3W9Y9_9ACTN